jgi:hypothetical protein
LRPCLNPLSSIHRPFDGQFSFPEASLFDFAEGIHPLESQSMQAFPRVAPAAAGSASAIAVENVT